MTAPHERGLPIVNPVDEFGATVRKLLTFFAIVTLARTIGRSTHAQARTDLRAAEPARR
jgi:hypothetical protein